MNPPPVPVSPPSEFKDRKTGLVVFGIFTALLGGLCALFVPLMLLGQTMAAKNGTPPPGGVAPAILIYGGLAVALIWLGIGSMMARRWARALLLIFAWNWLIIGVFSTAVVAFILPKIMAAGNLPTQPGQPELPPEARTIMVVVSLLMISVIYVVLPAIWVFFYRSKNVRATCEALDPVIRWTDRCPLPVIGVSLWLGFCAPVSLVAAFAYHGVVPAFGTFLVGPPGMAVFSLLALVWGISAWAFYRLDPRAWWAVFISLLLFTLSSCITYSRHDLAEAYTLMGYSEETIGQIQKFGFSKGHAILWISLLMSVPMFGYLLYVKRFFPGRAPD